MTAQMFRKKPIVVHAVQWTGANWVEMHEFTGGLFGDVAPGDHADPSITAQTYDSLHSTWVGLKTGQWVVRGGGEFYPIDEEVLAETYDRVEAGAA